MNIILLSGGSGKRLWPLSNDIRSKQFIKIFKTPDGQYESMVQRVYRQILSVDPEATVTMRRILIATAGTGIILRGTGLGAGGSHSVMVDGIIMDKGRGFSSLGRFTAGASPGFSTAGLAGGGIVAPFAEVMAEGFAIINNLSFGHRTALRAGFVIHGSLRTRGIGYPGILRSLEHEGMILALRRVKFIRPRTDRQQGQAHQRDQQQGHDTDYGFLHRNNPP